MGATQQWHPGDFSGTLQYALRGGSLFLAGSGERARSTACGVWTPHLHRAVTQRQTLSPRWRRSAHGPRARMRGARLNLRPGLPARPRCSITAAVSRYVIWSFACVHYCSSGGFVVIWAHFHLLNLYLVCAGGGWLDIVFQFRTNYRVRILCEVLTVGWCLIAS
jgi:hypothetical protein